MKSSKTAFSRCRPLLGTYVEISLEGRSDIALGQQADQAFGEIRAVEQAMSFHDPKSDLSRLNQTPVGRWLKVSSLIVEVLTLSLELQEKTSGSFNVAIADPLVQWGLLPGLKKPVAWHRLATPGFEVSKGKARRILPVRIDLGGIAKGFAVDRAVQWLEASSAVDSGLVNAGGDLRAFGSKRYWVGVRGDSLRILKLQNQALATSAVLSKRAGGVSRVSAYIDTRRRKPVIAKKYASVLASRCMIADALTKVALLMPTDQANRLAASYGARLSVQR